MTAPFTYRRSGTCGCEIVHPDGHVIAWTAHIGWAGMIVGLLNGADPHPQEEENDEAFHCDTYGDNN